MIDIYENIEEFNLNEKRKILIVIYDLIADSFSNKKRNPIVTDLFIRGIFYYTILFCCTKKILDKILHTILLWKF